MPRTKTAIAPTVDTVSLEADEESARLLADVKAAGLTMTGLQEVSDDGSKLGADIMISLYHAFDGRVWRGPLYMTTGEGGAMSLLKYRFDAEQVRLNQLDPKWIGKRVWYVDPQPVEGEEGRILCRFSVDLPDDRKKALQEQGFTALCRKDARFNTQAQEDFHVQKRHPRYYEYMKTKNAEDNSRRAIETQAAQTEALIALVEKLTKEK